MCDLLFNSKQNLVRLQANEAKKMRCLPSVKRIVQYWTWLFFVHLVSINLTASRGVSVNPHDGNALRK